MTFIGSGKSTFCKSSSVSVRPSALALPGESGDYASTPDAAALDIVGDIDLRIDVALDDWTPSSAEVLIAKWTPTGNNRSWVWQVATTGRMQLVWSVDGTATIATTNNADMNLTDGDRLWVRITMDVDNGASGRDTKFYRSTDGLNWTQIGTTNVGGATTSIFSSTAILEVGTISVGTGTPMTGDVFRAQVYSGVDGVKVFDADFSEQPPGTTSFAESSSNGATVTINQSGDPQAEIVAR